MNSHAKKNGIFYKNKLHFWNIFYIILSHKKIGIDKKVAIFDD